MRYSLASGDNDLVRGRAQVGSAEIIVCTDGTSLFDGGAMFGVVPKTLWSKKVSADAQNRIAIGLNCVVVKISGKTLLIETGFGNKLTPKLREIYGSQSLLMRSLVAAGIHPNEIDIVINSHLHWDHCSWNTTLESDGSIVPTFPNAQYIAHRGEVEHGRQQFERDRISYVADNYEPLIANGQMRLVDAADFGSDGRCDLLPGVSLQLFPGHTEQLMVVHIESDGEHACFVSDLVPTSAHVEPTWAMGYDLDPLRTTEERKRFYERAVPENWLVLFPHDHQVPMSLLKINDRDKVYAEEARRREKVTEITAGKPIPAATPQEEKRLASLYALNLLDTAPEREFDEIVELAATICGTPMGLMTLIDRNRAFHKSRIGIDIVEIPRGDTICQYTIQQPELTIVEDTRKDSRFDNNLFVQAEGGVRFYAGTPLVTPDGSTIGALCVVDTTPHHLSLEQKRALEILGRQIGLRIALRERERAAAEKTRELAQERQAFEEFMNALPVETYCKDEKGRIIFYNRKMGERFGISPTEWLGKTSHDLWQKDIADQIATEERHILKTGRGMESYIEMPCENGPSTFWKTIRVPFRQDGFANRIACIAIDMTNDLTREKNFQQTQDDLELANRKLATLSATDELTGLWNRRAFHIRIKEEMARAIRNKIPLSFALMDLDHFKAINDSYGHPFGDEVLKQVAGILTANKRGEDVAIRYGGEEFAILLPVTDEDAARRACERLLQAMRAYGWTNRAVTASFGIATLAKDESWEDLVSRADVALYAAKRQGRDRIVSHSRDLEK